MQLSWHILTNFQIQLKHLLNQLPASCVGFCAFQSDSFSWNCTHIHQNLSCHHCYLYPQTQKANFVKAENTSTTSYALTRKKKRDTDNIVLHPDKQLRRKYSIPIFFLSIINPNPKNKLKNKTLRTNVILLSYFQITWNKHNCHITITS